MRRAGDADRIRHIGAAAPVHFILAPYDLEFSGRLVGNERVLHPERVLLHAHLELFEAVVGETHRPAVAIEAGHQAIVREDRLVLGAVSHRVTDGEVDLADLEIGVRQQPRCAGRDLIWRLRRNQHMQRAVRSVVPDVAVVRLHGGRVDRLRVVVALQDKQGRIRLCSGDLLSDVGRRRHALCGWRPRPIRGRPDRLVAVELSEDCRIDRRCVGAIRIRHIVLHPHEARGPIMRRRLRAGDGAILHDVAVEAQSPLGSREPCEVLVDQERNGLAEDLRRLPLGHEEIFTVERATMRPDLVAREVLCRHQAIRLQIVAQRRKIDARESSVGKCRMDHEGVALLARPAGQVARPEIA